MNQEIIKVEKVLYFKSVSKSKKSVLLCDNPNITLADVKRVETLRKNKGKNKGDSSLMFGTFKATGYTALPNFGTNYRLSLDVSDATAKELPQVGDAYTLDVFVEQTEEGTTIPAKQVFNKRTNKLVPNQYWAYLPKK